MATSTPSASIRRQRTILWKVVRRNSSTLNTLNSLMWLQNRVTGNWYDAHALWAASNPPTTSEEYKTSVATWLQTDEGKGYQEDVLLDAQNNIIATKTDVRWKFNKKELDTPMILNRMLRSRTFGRKHASAVKPRFYQFAFVFAEGIRVVLRESVISLCIACVAVLVVLLLLLGDLWAACLVASSVIMVCLITYGSIYWYDDHLNNVSAFFVIIAVGLATDASAHYCVAFLESSKPTSKDRAVEALDLLGPPVFLGGTSTILGICLTGFCVTYVFQTFFRYLMTILILAVWFGLVVMPVVCALIGPKSRREAIVAKEDLEAVADAPISVLGRRADGGGTHLARAWFVHMVLPDALGHLT